MKNPVRIALIAFAAVLLAASLYLFYAAPPESAQSSPVYTRCAYVASVVDGEAQILTCDGYSLSAPAAPGLSAGASIDLQLRDLEMVGFTPTDNEYSRYAVLSGEREPCPLHVHGLREEAGEYYSDPVIYTESGEYYPRESLPGLTDGQAVLVKYDENGRFFSCVPIE